MAVTVQWLGHASFRISDGDVVVYIDPWKLEEAKRDADVVLVSHSHYDHYSSEDVAAVSTEDTELIASRDVIESAGMGRAIGPGEAIESAGVRISAVAAYNPTKQFHPRGNNWNGYIVELGGKRIYYAGDTDLTDEMRGLEEIDVGLFPVGGTYTMNAEEAAEAAGFIKPELAVPYHWGDIVGGRGDADSFAAQAGDKVRVIEPGEVIEL